ncbi:hypothetical protein LCGC14_1770230 [marine sediment metagenome]|uniref:Uncharacterized protein n=1 Tax=marine sediment metagenome TaxID=412755 RepID=A0A0F9GYJ8_9ZZZZ
MSMSNYACFRDCIDEEFVKSICPDEYAILIQEANKEDYGLEYYTDDLGDGNDCGNEAVSEAFEHLCKTFDKATGLFLGIVYHSAEDRADDLDGYAFTVDDVYVPSEAGKKYMQYITRKFWTTFG